MSWASWRRIRQAVQILFFAFYIYLIFAVVQQRAAPALSDHLLPPRPALSRWGNARQPPVDPQAGTGAGHSWADPHHRACLVRLDLPHGQPAGVGVFQESPQTRCFDLATLETGEILPAGNHPGSCLVRRADPAGIGPNRHLHPHADHSHPAGHFLCGQRGSRRFCITWTSYLQRWMRFEGLVRGGILPVEQPAFAQNVAIAALFFGIISLNLLAHRFWCRYLCPLGALLGLLSKISLVPPGDRDAPARSVPAVPSCANRGQSIRPRPISTSCHPNAPCAWIAWPTASRLTSASVYL